MLRALGFAFAAFAALGCASAGNLSVVQSEYWKGEDFASYRRYSWLRAELESHRRTQAEDHRLHDLIREAIDEQLASRGFTQTDSSAAEVLVTYHCRISEQLKVDVIDRVWYGTGDQARREDVTPRVELSSFEEGSIVIDFVKPREHRRVWRGVARGRVSPEAASEELRKVVDRAVKEILDEFPPPL